MTLPTYFFQAILGWDKNSQLVFNISNVVFYILANLKVVKMYLSKYGFRIYFFWYIEFKIFQTELIFNNAIHVTFNNLPIWKVISGQNNFKISENIRPEVIVPQAGRALKNHVISIVISKQGSIIRYMYSQIDRWTWSSSLLLKFNNTVNYSIHHIFIVILLFL